MTKLGVIGFARVQFEFRGFIEATKSGSKIIIKRHRERRRGVKASEERLGEMHDVDRCSEIRTRRNMHSSGRCLSGLVVSLRLSLSRGDSPLILGALINRRSLITMLSLLLVFHSHDISRRSERVEENRGRSALS